LIFCLNKRGNEMSQSYYGGLMVTKNAPGAIGKYLCVGFDGARAAVSGQKVLGIADTDAAQTDDYALTVLGPAPGISGAAFALGSKLITNAAGKLIAATGAAGEHAFCEAMEAATAADQQVQILIR
jgi:hypothetical protein